MIPASQAEELVIVCGVFIHWEAADDKKIYDYNYKATMDAIKNAMTGKPTAAEMLAARIQSIRSVASSPRSKIYENGLEQLFQPVFSLSFTKQSGLDYNFPCGFPRFESC